MMNMRLVVLDKARAEERHNRHRDQIGAEESDNHSKRKRGEEIFADAEEQQDGEEDNAVLKVAAKTAS